MTLGGNIFDNKKENYMKKNKYLKFRSFAGEDKKIRFGSMMLASLALLNGVSVALIGFMADVNSWIVLVHLMLSLLIFCMGLCFANSYFFAFSSNKESDSNRGAKGLLVLSVFLVYLSWVGFSDHVNDKTIKSLIAAQSSEVRQKNDLVSFYSSGEEV
jgi:hypothetical protein